jgi:hypothetical protein
VSGRQWQTKRHRVFDDFVCEGKRAREACLRGQSVTLCRVEATTKGGRHALGLGLPRLDALNGYDDWEVRLPQRSQAHV